MEIGQLLQDVKSEEINYTQIWRTIVNGYPYKEPREIGVDTEDEAYFVTQQAIYCVMVNRSMSLYRGISEDGEKIVEAIKNLKEIGLYGKQTPQDALLQVTEEGGIIEEGEYYTQTYTVTANVDISEFEVDTLDAYKNEIVVVDDAGKIRSTFSSGERFKVRIPKEKANQNREVDMIINAKCKTYPIFYGETTEKKIQSCAITYGEYRKFFYTK